jgi:hypothetical protein
MSKRIEIIGGSLIVTDTVTSVIEAELPSSDAFYNHESLDRDEKVKIYNSNGTNFREPNVFIALLSECVDKDLVVFTKSSFRDFARENLSGTASYSGGSILGISSVEYTDSSDHGTVAGKNTVMITCTSGVESIDGIVMPAGVYTFQPTLNNTVGEITVNANSGRIIIATL